ncbi:MAG: ADP-ribosylation factor-like protein [Promethearchaeota archaeon]
MRKKYGSNIARLKSIGKQNKLKKGFVFKKVSIFLFGLDKAGKTTFVEFLKNEKYKVQSPTLGISISELVLGLVKLEFNDLGGQKAFQKTWMDYWKDQDILIFMIDAADDARFDDACSALWRILDQPETQNKPLLLLSNKIDLPNAKRLDFVLKALNFDKIKRDLIGAYEISVKEQIGIDKALNFISGIILEENEMMSFVNEEIARMAKKLIKKYKNFLDSANKLEKSGKYLDALKLIYKAKKIQDNLLDLGFPKARKKSLKCLELMAKIEKIANDKGIILENKWWKDL